ncbi:MAG TPA: hypothetical protein VF158_11505 [Longimicrobiales bacterium]
MLPNTKANGKGGATWVLIGAAAAILSACSLDDLLRVDAPDVLTTDELQGPGEISTQINGIIGAFNEQFDNYVLYSGLLTDEFLAAGTFPTRIEVDARRMLADNATLTDEVAEVMHRARLMADTSVVNFTAAKDDPAFSDVIDLLDEGIVTGQFYGGYMRILLAELYCETPIANGPVQSSDALMEAGLALLQEAAAGAAATGQEEIAAAAKIGQARALMWLGRYAEAAAIADDTLIDAGFAFTADYSSNAPEQYNEVYTLTWGDGAALRWTVGAGNEAARHNERWPYFDEWVALGMIIDSANVKRITVNPFSSAVDLTNAQTKYPGYDADIPFATRAEADMILAEFHVREGTYAAANAIVNGYRSAHGLPDIDFGNVAALRASFEVPLPASADTDLKVRLAAMARERARELWITGERQGTLRRYLQRDGLDLYPVTGEGTDICFPIPQQELDNNPSL